jgi:hypothetical protein
MLRLIEPILEIVTLCELALPTRTFPKLMLAELTESTGWATEEAGWAPVPASEITFGRIVGLFDRERFPVAVPGTDARKVTLKFADCPRDKVNGRTGPL